MHYVIIGFSAAGLAAAKTIRERDALGQITVITEENEQVYSRCLLTYYLAGKINKEQMYLLTDDARNNLAIDVIKDTKVIAVDTANKVVKLAHGEAVKYDKLLIATGASPILPPTLTGSTDIVTLRTMSDAEGISQRLPEVKTITVLGDGLVAVTAAQALRKQGKAVNLVGIAPFILGQFLDPVSGRMAEAELTNSGVALYLGNTITETTLTSTGRLESVKISDGTRLPCELIVVATGVRPNMDIVTDTAIKTDRGILVNQLMETSVKDVFAAGDVTQARNLLFDEPTTVPLWPVAVEHGETAGINMTGGDAAYSGALSMNSVNIGTLSIIAAGCGNAAGPELEVLTAQRSVKEYRRMVLKNNVLVGYILVGNTEKAGILSALIRQKSDLSTIKEYLCNMRVNYPKMSAVHT